MRETLEKIIELKNKDNSKFASEFPEEKPIFVWAKASDEDLKNFEKELSIKVPIYLQNYFRLFNPINVNLMFVKILGLSTIIDSYNKFYTYQEVIQKGFIPIADEDGDLICINSEDETGRLYFYSHEEEDLQKTGKFWEGYLKGLIAQKEELDRK